MVGIMTALQTSLFQVPTYQKYLVKRENASNEPTTIANSSRNLFIIFTGRYYYDDTKIIGVTHLVQPTLTNNTFQNSYNRHKTATPLKHMNKLHAISRHRFKTTAARIHITANKPNVT